MKTLPFSKLKPGMVIVVRTDLGDEYSGRLISKHNGTKTFTFKDADGALYEHVSYEVYVGTPEPDPLDQIHPMLAKNVADYKNLDKDELLADPDWWLEEKYDGERQILSWLPTHASRGFRATTRVVGKNTGMLAENRRKLPHLANLNLGAIALGATVLDVELMHEGGFRRLRSIMGSDDDRALDLQSEHGNVYAVAFDILWLNGSDLRGLNFSTRRSILEKVLEQVYQPHTFLHRPPRGYLRLSPIARSEEEKRSLLDDVLARGGEGAMLKHVNGKYTDTTVPGRRSGDLLKIKPFEEADVIIYGFEMGKGEYNQHKYGAINFAQWVHESYLTEEMEKNVLPGGEIDWHLVEPYIMDGHLLVHMGSCSGITDEQEALFRADPRKYIGMSMEVKYQSRWPDTGLMRHPNFMRLREDKMSSECTYVPVQ